MKMRLRLILFTIAIAVAASTFAQTDVQLTQFYAAPTLYNPSAAGNTDFLRIRGGARLQWLGIENAPQSFVGTADMPFKLGKNRVGVGVALIQSSEGLYKSLNMGVQAAYKLNKWGGSWSFGVRIGFYDQAFKGSELYLPSDDDYHQGTDDALPTNDIHGTALDLDAGLWYEHPKFYAGLSCTHLTSPSITMNAENSGGGSETSGDRKYQFQADRTLYFTAGCNIPVKNTLFEIMPAILVKSNFTFTTAEIMARGRYRKFLSFGIGYRWDDAITATIGAEIKNFFIGYSYDYATSAIHSASSGSHELFVGYSMKLNLSDKNKNRHKSVRIL